MATPLLPKPDKAKVQHSFNGLRNGGVDATAARVGLEVEFKKALAYMDAQDGAIDDLTILLNNMGAKNIGEQDVADSV